MDTIEKENLQEKASIVGDYLLHKCKELMKKHPIIGDVRGVGLFVGIDLVTDRIKRTPASSQAKHILTRMKEERILLSIDGPHHNVLKFKPPMVFTKTNVDDVIKLLDLVLEEVRHEIEARNCALRHQSTCIMNGRSCSLANGIITNGINPEPAIKSI